MSTWYAAHLILYVKFEGHPQRKYPVWENSVLIKARTEEEGFAKAEKRGKEEEGDDDGTFRWGGKPARWVFAGVRKLTLCEDPESRPLGQPLVHDQPVRCATFSPDGRTVLTGGEDRTARWWESVAGRPLGPPLPQPGLVQAVAFAADGRLAVLAGDRGAARLWDVPRPVEGPTERVVLWVQVVTGLELDADDRVRALDGRAWQERRRWLEDWTGPPQP